MVIIRGYGGCHIREHSGYHAEYTVVIISGYSGYHARNIWWLSHREYKVVIIRDI